MTRNFRNVQSGRLPDGRYIYHPVKGSPIIITPGKDASEEIIIMLNQLDHDEALDDRYDAQHRSFYSETGKAIAKDSGKDMKADPIENHPDPAGDIFQQLFPDRMPTSIRKQKLADYLPRLTDKQREFILDHFGLLMTLEDIARRDGVTHQAVSDRKRKILNRLKQFFEADGLL